MKLVVERDVGARMRDGVVLRADVYRPEGAEACPVLLQRTPYGKGWSGTAFALTAAERGYAVVIQDTRGRWASEGDGYPFVHEMQDGYDSVEWAAAQPWSNGKVGMYGGSYVSYTQYAAAAMRPPALKTIIPAIEFSDPHAVMYVGGAFSLGVSVSWDLTALALMSIMQLPDDDAAKDRLMEQLIESVDGMSLGKTFVSLRPRRARSSRRTTFEQLPLNDMPLIGREGIVPFLTDVMAHPTFDEFWQPLACPTEALDIPVFHIGGWYDIFITSTLRNFVQGNSHRKVLIGPWVHGSMSGYVGEVDFGLQASDLFVLPDELQLSWFDYWLKGVENGTLDEPPVRIFVMGENRWRSEDEWPLARTQYTPYYLHSGGAANSLHGDGALSPAGPADEPLDSYVYDPRNPVPTRGGGLCCWQAALPAGAFDQRQVEARPDVLVYSTPPLEQEVEVTGPVEVHLWAASSAPDTDFTAKLVDVGPHDCAQGKPCGYARNVQDGIVRTGPIKPGEVCEYVIDLGGTSNVFKAGHRIRLEISSSNFPRFGRNANTGRPIGDEAELRTALQTVLHDAQHPSRVVLPIIPRG